MKNLRISLALGLFLATLLLGSEKAFAVAKTTIWTASGDSSSWTDSGNWDNGVPVDGDSVVFDNTSMIDNPYVSMFDTSGITLDSLTIQGPDDNDLNLSPSGDEFSSGTLNINNGITDTTNPGHDNVIVAGLSLMHTQTISSTGGLILQGTLNQETKNITLSTSGRGIITLSSLVPYAPEGTIFVRGNGNGINIHTAIKTFVDHRSGKLWGTGSLGGYDMHPDGWISPGNRVGTQVACMKTGKMFMAGTYHVDILGTGACSGYDQLSVVGKAQLGYPTLDISLGSFHPAKGSSYRIIRNDGADPIIGRFTDHKEGKSFSVGGYTFKITYQGGDGNDVVLTRL